MLLRVLVAAGLLGGASLSFADLFVLNATKDLRILSFSPSTNDNAQGLSTYHTSGNIQRTLIEFDYTALTGQTIVSAILRLKGRSWDNSTNATIIDLYRPVVDWSETTATWLNSSTGTGWANAGGDAVGTGGNQLADPFSTWSGNMTDTSAWYEFDATALVSGAVVGQFDNHGFLLAGPNTNRLTFVSREGNNFSGQAGLVTEVPELVVTTLVPEPATIAVFGLGLLGAQRWKRSSKPIG